jgi:hypothetical protein
MPKRSTKRPRDINQLAKFVVDVATGKVPKPEARTDERKNPAAVALGRLGGLKGGKARAKKLGKKKLSEIGKKGARARWGD